MSKKNTKAGIEENGVKMTIYILFFKNCRAHLKMQTVLIFYSVKRENERKEKEVVYPTLTSSFAENLQAY